MNVGDYVRDHIYGIGKIIKCYDNELEIVFKKSRIKTSVNSYFEFNLNKSSPQIIDLIEKDDLLKIEYRILPNATQTEIVQVIENKDKKLFVHLWKGDYFIEDIVNNGMIKQILTHEQFESEAYRVEE